MTDDTRQIVDSRQLKAMSPAEIGQATKAGRMDALLQGCDIRKGATLNAAQWGKVIANLAPDELVKAEADGLLAPLEALTHPETPGEGADQGARGTPAFGSSEWIAKAGPEEVRDALLAGRLNGILDGSGPR